ncbi:phenylalanine 4-monooxygenase [Hymenobacter sp. BT507]|uniref:Phenylalanine 4-monooxygenase n=2 Tax=Hymenobacter citatus TaxID=2763506 RepID=A0ABR7ML36_9BACT|nr:phenylalanine 4-monooxygenase [Hymenobacter citatus]
MPNAMDTQHYHHYTTQDQLVWKVLFDRQTALLHKRAAVAFEQGLQQVGFQRTAIPRFEEVSERLRRRTGWEIAPVEGELDAVTFFGLLADRKFPVTTWIRSMQQFDFIEQPDLFHCAFGHLPLLMDHAFADFLHFLGRVAGQHLHDSVALQKLARLYGFTVQFGLVTEGGSTRIYGAGLLSSAGEIHHWLNSTDVRHPFDLATVLHTPYSEAHYQDQYFVLNSWDQLTESVADLAALLASNWQLAVR